MTSSNTEKRNPEDNEYVKLVAPQASPRTYEVLYLNVVIYLYWHIGGLYGLYLIFGAKWQTVVYTVITYMASALGVTAGSHRLWAHKTYKAKRPLEIFLMLCHCMSGQNSIIFWVRDHRLHHKYSDTDADPHNPTRGLFFSHCGWIFVKKHPEVIKRGRTIDVSDVQNNPVLVFQKKYIIHLTILLGMVLPALIPLCWNESWNRAWHLSLLRLITNMNVTFCLNSIAHALGNKPYDKSIAATQLSALSWIALGESFHNYHHVFPWDYRTAELGNNFFNFTTIFIDFCAKRGWAYDLKSASQDMVEKRMVRTGDGSNLWGWGEKITPSTQKSLGSQSQGFLGSQKSKRAQNYIQSQDVSIKEER